MIYYYYFLNYLLVYAPGHFLHVKCILSVLVLLFCLFV